MEILSFCQSLLILPGSRYQHSSNKAQVGGVLCNKPIVPHLAMWALSYLPSRYCLQFFKTVLKVLELQWLSTLLLSPGAFSLILVPNQQRFQQKKVLEIFLHYLEAITKRPLLRPSVSSSEIFAWFHAVPALPASEICCLTFRTPGQRWGNPPHPTQAHPFMCKYSWFWLAVKGKMGGKRCFQVLRRIKAYNHRKYKCHENHHVNHPSRPGVSHRQLLALPLSESLSPAGKGIKNMFSITLTPCLWNQWPLTQSRSRFHASLLGSGFWSEEPLLWECVSRA